MKLGILPAMALLYASLTYVAPSLAYEPTEPLDPVTGSSQSSTVEFVTLGDSGTTWTQIWVYNQSAGITQPSASFYHSSGNCDDTKCAYTFPNPLAPGHYIWSARSWGLDDGGTYSDWSYPYGSFSIGIPGKVDPVAPPESGEWYVGSAGFNMFPYSFQFRWEDDPLATEYEFWAVDSVGILTNLVVPRAGGAGFAPMACNGFCSWYDADEVQFNAGPVQWWVRGLANGVPGPWSSSARFWEGGVPDTNFGATITPNTSTGANRLNLGGVDGVFIQDWDVPEFNSEITNTWIYASNTRGGNDLHNQQYPVSNRQATITGIGSYTSIWVRYWFEVAGFWYYYDFQYLNN